MKYIIKLLILIGSINLILPITTTFATNPGTPPSFVENINSNSEIIQTIEKTRNDKKGQGFDDLMNDIREPSKVLGVVMTVIGGFVFLIGFIVTPLKKVGGMILVGVALGLLLINYGEYIIGFLFGLYDMLTGK